MAEQMATLVERAFLFTDLQGSTQAWEQAPTVMNGVLAEHDRLLREAIAAHGGQIISVAGDAFGAAFASSVDATAAAADAQRTLADTAWPAGYRPRVRMGVHRGPAYPRDDNFFGSTPNRAARLMSAAHGGQVVVSDDVAAALRDHPLAGISVRPLGIHRLKDVAEPIAVWQVRIDDLEDEFPPLASADAATVAVPRARTRFLGRGEELATLTAWLAEPAVITVLAAGGTGKTRLRVRGGVGLRRALPPRRDDGGVGRQRSRRRRRPVARGRLRRGAAGPRRARGGARRRAHGAPRRPSGPARGRQLRARRRGRLPDRHGARAQLPRLSVLATSREPLGVEGERILRLAPLAADPAVALFLDRATAAGHPVDDADLPAVRRSAPRSTVCRSASSWLPPGRERSHRRRSPSASARTSRSCGSAEVPVPSATGHSRPPSPGRTTSWPSPNDACSRPFRPSTAAPTSPPPRPSGAGWRATTCSRCWMPWWTDRW